MYTGSLLVYRELIGIQFSCIQGVFRYMYQELLSKHRALWYLEHLGI